ncbi:hypothetical protein NC653_004103 [Populus alba x Populus x berolinensis]|uniref:Uncharacterized protein n=1 Tax=Populus alba x Populus x berolinensis TaxID=444605 RepID=A0AAD6WJK0_9ROSI|nr:hypothetical protein NC653_004103 [Populus alba x Populus x berolinensis]
MTVPETPSHDQPCDVMCAGVWKENVNSHESGPNELKSLQKRQNTLLSCLNMFKRVAS